MLIYLYIKSKQGYTKICVSFSGVKMTLKLAWSLAKAFSPLHAFCPIQFKPVSSSTPATVSVQLNNRPDQMARRAVFRGESVAGYIKVLGLATLRKQTIYIHRKTFYIQTSDSPGKTVVPLRSERKAPGGKWLDPYASRRKHSLCCFAQATSPCTSSAKAGSRPDETAYFCLVKVSLGRSHPLR